MSRAPNIPFETYSIQITENDRVIILKALAVLEDERRAATDYESAMIANLAEFFITLPDLCEQFKD